MKIMNGKQLLQLCIVFSIHYVCYRIRLFIDTCSNKNRMYSRLNLEYNIFKHLYFQLYKECTFEKIPLNLERLIKLMLLERKLTQAPYILKYNQDSRRYILKERNVSDIINTLFVEPSVRST